MTRTIWMTLMAGMITLSFSACTTSETTTTTTTRSAAMRGDGTADTPRGMTTSDQGMSGGYGGGMGAGPR